MVSRLVVRVVCALLLAASTVGVAGAEPPQIYVSLGESGAAGPFIADQLDPLGCFRSDRNYAHLSAAALGLTLRDASCSGAKIAEAYAPQPLLFGQANGPQLDAVGADATIVSVDFGVNDFVGDGWSGTALATKIAVLLEDIAARAPRADIFVMGKVQRVRAGGCFPALPIPPPMADRLDAAVREINALLAAAAAAHGAVFVDVYPGSVGHDACAPEQDRWSEGLVPSAPAQPLHANAAGHRYEADQLTEAIRQRR